VFVTDSNTPGVTDVSVLSPDWLSHATHTHTHSNTPGVTAVSILSPDWLSRATHTHTHSNTPGVTAVSVLSPDWLSHATHTHTAIHQVSLLSAYCHLIGCHMPDTNTHIQVLFTGPLVLWLPSVLCHCWLGIRKRSIRPVRKWVMNWRGYLS